MSVLRATTVGTGNTDEPVEVISMATDAAGGAEVTAGALACAVTLLVLSGEG